jgi:hypothetical protein
MVEIFILLSMLFMHIVDDYYLQGILASMKQKSWWQKLESYKDFYKYDYIVALIMHSFSWAFMVMMPIAFTMSFSVTIEKDNQVVSSWEDGDKYTCHQLCGWRWLESEDGKIIKEIIPGKRYQATLVKYAKILKDLEANND